MEKKKLLLVAISVGVFLVLTIGAAILVFTPRNANFPFQTVTSNSNSGTITVNPPPSYQPTGSAAEQQPPTYDAVDLVRNPGGIPGLITPPEGTTREGAGSTANETGSG
jgi:DedD protein